MATPAPKGALEFPVWSSSCSEENGEEAGVGGLGLRQWVAGGKVGDRIRSWKGQPGKIQLH